MANAPKINVTASPFSAKSLTKVCEHIGLEYDTAKLWSKGGSIHSRENGVWHSEDLIIEAVRRWPELARMTGKGGADALIDTALMTPRERKVHFEAILAEMKVGVTRKELMKVSDHVTRVREIAQIIHQHLRQGRIKFPARLEGKTKRGAICKEYDSWMHDLLRDIQRDVDKLGDPDAVNSEYMQDDAEEPDEGDE